MNRKKGVIYIALGAIIWSFGGLFIKLITMEPLAIAGWRSFFAAIFMWVALKYEQEKITKNTNFVRSEDLEIQTKDKGKNSKFNFSKWSIIGSVAYCGTVILFVIATKLTTAANAILIQYTAPIYVALLSRLVLNEFIIKRDWIMISITFLGMLLFFSENIFASTIDHNTIQSTNNGLGNLIAILSGICFAFTVLALRKEKNNSTLQPIFWGNLLTAFIALPLAAFKVGWLVVPIGMNWGYLAFLGFIQLGFGYLFFARGAKLVSAIEASLVPIIEPILNPIWVAIFYNEFPSILSILGGLVVILSVSLRSVLNINVNPDQQLNQSLKE